MKWIIGFILFSSSLVASECNCYSILYDRYKNIESLNKYEEIQNDNDDFVTEYGIDLMIQRAYNQGYIHAYEEAVKLLRIEYDKDRKVKK